MTNRTALEALIEARSQTMVLSARPSDAMRQALMGDDLSDMTRRTVSLNEAALSARQGMAESLAEFFSQPDFGENSAAHAMVELMRASLLDGDHFAFSSPNSAITSLAEAARASLGAHELANRLGAFSAMDKKLDRQRGLVEQSILSSSIYSGVEEAILQRQSLALGAAAAFQDMARLGGLASASRILELDQATATTESDVFRFVNDLGSAFEAEGQLDNDLIERSFEFIAYAYGRAESAVKNWEKQTWLALVSWVLTILLFTLSYMQSAELEEKVDEWIETQAAIASQLESLSGSDDGYDQVITARHSVLRTDPDAGAKRIREFPAGQRLWVSERRGNWLRVVYFNPALDVEEFGWVSKYKVRADHGHSD